MQEIIYNSYERNIAIYGDFVVPVPTYIMDKKIDFSIILYLILISNSNKDEENDRYVDDANIDKKELCRICNISERVLKTRMKYLEEKGILVSSSTARGLVHRIKYSKDGLYYVSIQHKMLKSLLDNTDNNIIKTYLILYLQCKKLKNKKPMSNAFICSQIGYSPKSNENLNNIGKWTDVLVEKGFIKKHKKTILDVNEKGHKYILRIDTYYHINSFKEWKYVNRKKVQN